MRSCRPLATAAAALAVLAFVVPQVPVVWCQSSNHQGIELALAPCSKAPLVPMPSGVGMRSWSCACADVLLEQPSASAQPPVVAQAVAAARVTPSAAPPPVFDPAGAWLAPRQRGPGLSLVQASVLLI